MNKQEIIKQDVVCSKCGYEWTTKSRLIKLTCPSCQMKTKRIEREIKNGFD